MFLAGNLKKTIAKADVNEIAILPTAIHVATIVVLNNILATEQTFVHYRPQLKLDCNFLETDLQAIKAWVDELPPHL